MGTPVTALFRQHRITTDFDVVTMRQDVRQAARELGLGLSQQAKIAAAISTIARALLAAHVSMTVQLRVDDAAPHPALVVTCRFRPDHHLNDLAHLRQDLRFGEVQMLADEATLSLDDHGVLLSLHIWLSR